MFHKKITDCHDKCFPKVRLSRTGKCVKDKLWVTQGTKRSSNHKTNCLKNRLHLNLDKTCYSIFGPNYKNMKGFKLYINSKDIEHVEYCKYLGILINSDLKLQDYINYVYNKLIKFTSIFYKIRTKLPEEILRMIYFVFLHCHLLYGIEVYVNTTAITTCQK